ncbi:hypothetical protein [Methylococcus geothermalis]|uniref:Uncharacterized protein n=1 Tax=Methylococcus geothermalis TaxID=2681310 RepID=A0A858Q7N4_9GAMM|nr:hypothetical protein [Methylococcus geothermalis]QJD29821.1 hypothetical protein GNH96_07430 [Methylococcus geothermalis]
MKKLLLATRPAALFSAQLQAGCKTPDLNGTWIMYQSNLAEQHTGRCEVSIVRGSATGHCVMGHHIEFDVTGTGSVDRNGAASLQLDFSGGSSTFDLQLARNKLSFVGQWSNTFGTGGISNGVKR